MAQFQAVITRRVVENLPGVILQRLADHLGDDLEGVRNPGNKAQGLEIGRMVLAVELAIGNQLAWGGGVLKGREQGLGSLLENLAIRGIAIPIFAR